MQIKKTIGTHYIHRSSAWPCPRYQFPTKLLRIISTGPWFHRIHAVGMQGDAEKSEWIICKGKSEESEAIEYIDCLYWQKWLSVNDSLPSDQTHRLQLSGGRELRLSNMYDSGKEARDLSGRRSRVEMQRGAAAVTCLCGGDGLVISRRLTPDQRDTLVTHPVAVTQIKGVICVASAKHVFFRSECKWRLQRDRLSWCSELSSLQTDMPSCIHDAND